MKHFFRFKSIFILLLTVIFVGLTALPCFAATAETVVVTGRSELQAPADRVVISFSVETRGGTKEDATAQNEKLIQRVTKAASSYGTVCRNAFYSYQDGCSSKFCTVSHFTLQSDRPKEAAAIFDKLIAMGASSVDPPQYELSDRSAWEAKALTAAIADAQERAKLCAAGDRLMALIDRREDYCCYACRDGSYDATVTVICTVTLTYRR
jgi:uncharacterized protein YggE